jgi:hypothetical protein
MPRDGLGQYSPPPGTNGIPNFTIESTKYNGYVADVTQDLNLPRPIVAGGTGAINAHDAMVNLSGEIAGQVVTNYDSFPFVAGSFYSLPGATSAPVVGAYLAGICYLIDANGMSVEARDINTGILYVRTKTSGVWGSWSQQAGSQAVLDGAYVNKAGDTMSGNLIISKTTPSLGLNKTAAADGNVINGGRSNILRWSLGLGDATAETGSGNIGSNFSLSRFTDAGVVIDIPFSIARSNGIVFVQQELQVMGTHVTSGAGAATGTYYFGNSGTKYLTYDGTNFNFGGGAVYSSAGIYANGDIQSAKTATTGAYYFGNTGTKFLSYDGTNFTLGGGAVIAGVGVNCRDGVTGVPTLDYFNFKYQAGLLHGYVDTTWLGSINFTPSDYRIKKDVIDLPGMWDTVKALRPIKYTHAEFSPPSHVKYIADETAKARKEGGETTREVPGPFIPADDIERWGFIAHELQATLVPSAATGVKDIPDAIQSPNPFTLIAALTKALQEAMARIEALEAR